MCFKYIYVVACIYLTHIVFLFSLLNPLTPLCNKNAPKCTYCTVHVVISWVTFWVEFFGIQMRHSDTESAEIELFSRISSLLKIATLQKCKIYGLVFIYSFIYLWCFYVFFISFLSFFSFVIIVKGLFGI